ncbi:MAG: DUF1028 domain-containing protein [Spirosomataceae bacterium]
MKLKTPFVSIALIIVAMLFCQIKANATWSIIILDAKTKTVGVAGASCTFEVSGIAKIITGKGAIIAQAYSDDGITNRGLELLRKNATPLEILKVLQDKDFDKEVAFRQYGIVTFEHYDNPVVFTGDSISYYPYAATATSPGISVQGNTLADKKVVEEVHKAVLEGRKKNLSLEELLMMALEVGSKYGGDRRCGVQTATTAFIQIVRPKDTYCSSLMLRTGGIKTGGPNATKVIRNELNKLKKELANNKCTEVAIFPKD